VKFCLSRQAILKRESALILETAQRLFEDQSLDKLWFHPPGLSHQDTLQALDALCDFISRLNNSMSRDTALVNANALVDLWLKTPLFELDEVMAKIKGTRHTTAKGFAQRLNQRFRRLPFVFQASEQIEADTMTWYAALRRQFLDDRRRTQMSG